jgi:hypothetical protein
MGCRHRTFCRLSLETYSPSRASCAQLTRSARADRPRGVGPSSGWCWTLNAERWTLDAGRWMEDDTVDAVDGREGRKGHHALLRLPGGDYTIPYPPAHSGQIQFTSLQFLKTTRTPGPKGPVRT